MSGIVFVVGLAAFLLVAHWAFINDAAKADSGFLGLLAMRSDDEPAGGPRDRPARWKRLAIGGGPSRFRRGQPDGSLPPPRWKRPRGGSR